MAANRFYTNDEWQLMMKMRYEGKSMKEIADVVNRLESAVSKRFAVKSKEYKEYKIKMYKENTPAVPPPAPSKEKTLSDFSPRDIIRHLYDLGYRIENNALVYYSKQYIKLNDIVNG